MLTPLLVLVAAAAVLAVPFVVVGEGEGVGRGAVAGGVSALLEAAKQRRGEEYTCITVCCTVQHSGYSIQHTVPGNSTMNLKLPGREEEKHLQ